MTITSGTLAIKRFKALTFDKHLDFPSIVSRLSKQLISPLTIADTREEASGFCHPFSGEPVLDNVQALVFENAFVFGLRFDKKKIPSTFLKIQLHNALQALGHGTEDETGQSRKIPKKIKDTVRDTLKNELLKNMLPHVRLVEIVWHLESHEIWLMSQATKVVEEFEKLFFECFGLTLVHLNPGTIPLNFDLLEAHKGQETLDTLIDTLPVLFLQEQEPEMRAKEIVF